MLERSKEGDKRQETYNIITIQITRRVRGHPDRNALHLRRVRHAAQGDVPNPGVDEFLAFFGEELADQVCLHVTRREAVDTDAGGAPSGDADNLAHMCIDRDLVNQE